MESFARDFDRPIDSPEHQFLLQSLWLGGSDVIVRYWLGRVLNRNLFRVSTDAVADFLERFLISSGFEKAAQFAHDLQSWQPIGIVLPDYVGTSVDATKRNPRLVAAIKATLANPNLTDSEIAVIAKTTAKQVAQMCEITVLRRCWKIAQLVQQNA